MSVFRLPDLGEGLRDAELIEWRVAAGDIIAVNQIVAEVETAKAVVELPSPYAGIVRELRYAAGAIVPVGEVLLVIETGDSDAPDADAADSNADEIDTAAPAPGVLVGYGPPPPDLHIPRPVRPASATERIRGERGLPAQRRMAATMAAAAHIPQATVLQDLDCTNLLARVAALRAQADTTHVTPLAVIAHECVALLIDTPLLNAAWIEQSSTIETHKSVHLGIATAGSRGLAVPSIKQAEQLSHIDLAARLAAVTHAARDGTATPSDLSGATFTITNFGVFEVKSGIPIVVPGQAAILGIGQIAQRPWIVDGTVAPRPVVTLSLSFDHRVADGETAARFLATLTTRLEECAH